MGEASLPSRTVDENTLNHGFVVLTGGEDRFGRPILTFPTTEILSITKQTTPASLTLNLQYYLNLLPPDKRAFGVSILANFHAATKDVIVLVCESLENVQTESPKAINTLYAIVPKNKDLQRTLKKLLGLKASKKNPKIPVYEAVLLQDKTGLTQYIAGNQLTDEYGGSLMYNHQAWIVFKRKYEELERDVRSVEAKLPDTTDKVNMLLEYDIPTSVEDTQTLLNSIQQKYNDLMKEIKIEVAIDDLGTFQDKIDNPGSNPTFAQIAATVTFKEAKVKVQGHRSKLIKIRKDLAAVYGQAEERINTASKIGKYKQKADKVVLWLTDIGFPTVNQDPEIADCLPQAEILKNHFHTGFYSIAKDVLVVSEKIISKFDILVKEVRGHGTQDLISYRKSFLTTINRFKDMVEKKKQVYENVYNFFFNAVLLPTHSEKDNHISREIKKAVRWYHKALTFLPIQLLQQPSIPNSENSASVYVSAALRVAMENFLLRHPAPSNNHLNKIKSLIPSVKDATIKNQARLTVQRVSDLKRLMCNPETLTVQSLKDIIFWKQQLAAGQDDLYPGDNTVNVEDSILSSVPHFSVPDLSHDMNMSRFNASQNNIPSRARQDGFGNLSKRPATSLANRSQTFAQNSSQGSNYPKELSRDLSYVTWRKQKMSKNLPRHHQSFSHGTGRSYIQEHFRNPPQRSESQRQSPFMFSQSTLEINQTKNSVDSDALGRRTPKLRFVGVDDSAESIEDSKIQGRMEDPGHGVRFRTRSMNALNQKDNVLKSFDIEGESDYPSDRQNYLPNSKRTLFPTHMSRSFDEKERYVALSYPKPDTSDLPESLQHIDVHALRRNVPQHSNNLDLNGHLFRDRRPIQSVPSVKITDTSLANSMPNLARPTNIEAISHSDLSVEDKLNLMSMLCESDETDNSIPVRPESAFDSEFRTRRQHSRSRPPRPPRPASAGPRNFENTFNNSNRNTQLPLTYHRKSFEENSTENTLARGKPVVRSRSGASRWSTSLPHPRRLALLREAAAAKAQEKRAHYGIDIEQWMRSQHQTPHSDAFEDETDQPADSEVSDPASIEEEEVMQNEVASSLQRVHDILKEADMKVTETMHLAESTSIQESGTSQDHPERELDSHNHNPVEGSLSEESGIFTHESADISRVRPLDSITNMSQSMDSRAGVFVPSLRPSTTSLCSKPYSKPNGHTSEIGTSLSSDMTPEGDTEHPQLKSVPPLLTKSTSNLSKLMTQEEVKGQGDLGDLHSQGHDLVQDGDLVGDSGTAQKSRLSATLVGNHNHFNYHDSRTFSELATSSQA